MTKVAYSIVTVYGMNDKIGNVSFYDSKQNDYSFNKPYSDATAKVIDEEVKKIISDAYDRTKNLLTEKKEQLEILAKELLKKEIIFQSDLEGLIGKRPFEKQTAYEAFTNNNGQADKEATAEVVTEEEASPETPTADSSEETKEKE